MTKYDYLFLLVYICIQSYRIWKLRDRVDELEDAIEELQEKLEGETRE